MPREVIEQCLEIAIQAPTGGNIPRYHFVVVTDAAKRAPLAALYKRAYLEVYSPQRQAEVRQSDPRLIESATYLAEHLREVPVLIIPCVEAPPVQGTGPGVYASILPATWSLMLALPISDTNRKLPHSWASPSTFAKRRCYLWHTTRVTTSNWQNGCLHGSGRIGMGGGRRCRCALEGHDG